MVKIIKPEPRIPADTAYREPAERPGERGVTGGQHQHVHVELSAVSEPRPFLSHLGDALWVGDQRHVGQIERGVIVLAPQF